MKGNAYSSCYCVVSSEHLCLDAIVAGPLCFGTLSHTNNEHDHIWRNRTDWQASLELHGQHSNLESVRLQAKYSVRQTP